MSAEHPEGVDIWTAARRWHAAKHGTDPSAPSDYVPSTAATWTGEDHPYVGPALDGACRDIASMGEGGGRNAAVNAQLARFCGYAAAGHVQEGRVVSAIRDAAMASGLGGLELRRLFRTDASGAIVAGRTHPQDPPARRSPEPAPAAMAEDFPSWVPIDPTTGEVLEDPASPPSAEELEVRRQARALAQELATQRIRRAARQLLDDEEHAAAFRTPPGTDTLAQELDLPDDPVEYAVAELVPAGANVLLTAAFKAGKTTLMNNLAAAFADAPATGEKFLGRFDVHPPATGRMALWNYEVSAGQYRRWLRQESIGHPERLVVLNLRGYQVPLTVPKVADWAVDWLRRHEVVWWAIDPFARAFNGTSENDNSEVGRWLDAVDVIQERAGVQVLFLPTHTGREVQEAGAERARGATRLDDWADVRWLLTKDAGGNRFLRATGRDVEVAEEQLAYDERTRRLLFGGGDRAWVKRKDRVDLLVQVVTASPGITTRALRKAFNDALRAAGQTGMRNEGVDAVAADAARAHRISVEDLGDGLPTRHHPIRTTNDAATAPTSIEFTAGVDVWNTPSTPPGIDPEEEQS